MWSLTIVDVVHKSGIGLQKGVLQVQVVGQDVGSWQIDRAGPQRVR